MPSYKKIAVASIDFDHGLWPVREFIRPEDVERLRSDIRANGLRDHIVVREDPGNPSRYQIVEGRVRLEVALTEEWPTIPARIESLSVGEAAVRVVASECATWSKRTLLERAWMVVDAQRSMEAARLPATLDAMEEAFSTSRSTLGNALQVGRHFPRRRIAAFAARFGVPIGRLLDVQQGVLLLIAQQPSADRYRLAEAALTAHLQGRSPMKIVERLIGSRKTEPPRLEVTGSGQLRLQNGRPLKEMSASELRSLAQNCEKVGATLRELSNTRPIGEQGIQELDGLWRKVPALLRSWIRRVDAWCRGAWGGLVRGLKARGDA